MFKSIRSRLIASYLLVTLLAMAVAAVLAWTALDRAFLDVLRENLLAQAQRVAQTIESSELGQAPPAAYSQFSNVLPGYHARVIDSEGVVVLDLAADGTAAEGEAPEVSFASYGQELISNLGLSRPDTRGQPPADELMIRPEIQAALAGEPSTEIRSYDWAPERRVLYAAYPVTAAEGFVVSIVYIASPLPRLTLSLLPDYFGLRALGGIAMAVLLAALAGILLARQLTRPLHRLTQAASALAQGEVPPPIPPTSTNELQRLSEAFNTMNANLTTAYGALASQARQREAILDGLADAVLATDASGKIILANPAAAALREIMPRPLREAIDETLARGEAHTAEITARGQVVELLVTPLRDEEGQIGGAVAVGHDVTAYRQLDRLRTEFVSDVSHELRTPLTAIKGFVETLQDGAIDDPAVRDRFLHTLSIETDRLIQLTNDLLFLSRADTGRLDLRLASTDLIAAAHRAAAQMAERARQKRIALSIESVESPLLAFADADRVHQVLINLLSNAVKFTPAEGRVIVVLGREGELVSCTVSDTGSGIPADEIPHLFERFYRGEPSRARDGHESGAGLGLAIAEAIVKAHGGQIWVESEPGQGTAVTFTVPPAP